MSNFLCVLFVCNILVIKELILICHGASCCFTVSHNQGLLLTGPPRNEIYWVFKCLCYLSKGLLTETRLPVGWPDRWLGCSIDAGTNKGEWYESVSMIWSILPIHQLWIAQKWYRKRSLIDFFFFFINFCWACTSDAESSLNMLFGWQACNLLWRF